ncbi:phage terminase large subunit family protein [Marinovum sp. SP66]|uniref:phage terminase large subunit family protein n=1 Tax=Marinovum sp. SP66 TaxID=3028379 RepID=UPI00237B94D8|nr:terminase gpA endonuclease subunit [Marinovum sp. SP66]MDD9738438.1 phage terminase large subunit family protein [Marinovum sp. SP66]
MGFLVSAEQVIARAIAQAIAPPPPPDITRWCEENIVFDARSPMPGRFDVSRFAFLREIHEVLSPEHAAREVTIRGSAQWGKTVSIIQPTLAEWHEYTPLDSLIVHPTGSAASEWVNNKWMPMRRQAPGLIRVFGAGRGENRDNTFNQETLDRNGSLKVASAGSPADLTGTSRRLVIMDDLSKFEPSEKGDPEKLAESRASGFEDAKIARVSTAMIKGTCRITSAYERSDQRLYHVPCPNCGHEQPLTWENFRDQIDPENLAAAHFRCERCTKPIRHGDKEKIVRLGRWVKRNPGGSHPGFHLWRAYAPQRDWASIAVEYAQVMGWTRLEAGSSAKKPAAPTAVSAGVEQVFWNDVLGLPYEQATDAPDWEKLRDRTENAEPGEVLERGVLPATGFIFAAGVDCQDDRLEVQLVAFGRNRRRWVIDYRVIPHHIGDEDGRAALNALLKQRWKTELGLPIAIDMLAIDGGAYTDDVWSWARVHPWSRVIIVKGASKQNGPLMSLQKFERRKDGKAKRAQKRAFNLNVSSLKAGLYAHLGKEDPAERGHTRFARALGDEYYRMLASETRVVRRNAQGVMTSRWDLVEPTRRNEALDTMNYAEAAAMRRGWHSMTDDQWDALGVERAAPPPDQQGDLFDADLPLARASKRGVTAKTKPETDAAKRLLNVLRPDGD